MTDEHGLLAGSLEWEDRNPFDRMTAAQCRRESLPLATADEAFRSLSKVQVLW